MEGAKRCDGPSKHKLQNFKKKYCWIVCRQLPDCGKHACILLCYVNLFHNSDIMCRSLLCSFVNSHRSGPIFSAAAKCYFCFRLVYKKYLKKLKGVFVFAWESGSDFFSEFDVGK